MTFTDKLKSLLGRGPVTEEERAARAEAEIERERVLDEVADHTAHANAQFPPTP